MSKYCTKCKGVSLGNLQKFCPNDGTELVNLPKCPKCSEEYLLHYKFCVKCGTEIKKE